MPIDEEIYSADKLNRIAGRIWELRLPERPRFVQDLLRIPLQNGMHLLGAEPQTLRGESVQWVMDSLVPLLDGSRSLVDLCIALSDVPAASLLDALQLMHMHGMLEEAQTVSASECEELEERFGPQMAFFSRYLRVTGRCRNRYEAQSALLRARVALVGQLDATADLARHLAAMGVGETLCVAPRPDGEQAAAIGWSPDCLAGRTQLDLVVVVGGMVMQEATVRDCIAANWPLLAVDPTTLTLGPLTYPRVSACPVCTQRQVLEDDRRADTASPVVHHLWTHALVSRAAQHVVAYLTGLYQPSVVGGVELWHPQTGDSELRQVPRLPNCPACGDSVTPLTVTLPTGVRDNMAMLYHRNVAIQPWHLQHPAGMQHHLSAPVQRLTRSAYVQYGWAEQLPLSDTSDGLESLAGSLFAVEPRPGAPVGLHRLGTLLQYSAGGRSTPLGGDGYHLQRHVASGGNLGSAEIFVVSLDVPNLAPGLYHYLPIDHSLEILQLGHFRDDIMHCLADGATGTDLHAMREAAAVLAIVSAVDRECAKYAERGYMYCLLDAGLMAHRLEFLSAQLGLRSLLAWDFADDVVSDLLGVDGFHLAPQILVALGGGSDETPWSRGDDHE